MSLSPLALISALILTTCLASAAGADELYTEFPHTIRANERYVIYSHGFIVEGDNPTPRHPAFGVYDFPGIKQALFVGGGYNLIAHQRPKDTDIASYSAQLESWVQRLLAAGVPASRITLVGFSRGSHLNAYAASRLRDTGVSMALLGACLNGGIRERFGPLVFGGHLLSIYETTDEVLSCKPLADRSRLLSFEEIAITTGKRHGAFFQPLAQWIAPLRAWIAKTNR